MENTENAEAATKQESSPSSSSSMVISTKSVTPTLFKAANAVGSGSMSNKPDIKISSDGVAKLNFSFLDEMHGGDSSLEPGEVVTPPHSLSPLPLPAAKPPSSLTLDSTTTSKSTPVLTLNIKEVRRGTPQQTEAQVCEEKVRAILELDAIRRKEEIEKRKQELEKRRQSGELEREEEAKRIAKAERKRIKKIEKEQRAARLALMSDNDNDNEQRVPSDSSKKRDRRSEDRQSYESGERVSSSDEGDATEISPACEREQQPMRPAVSSVAVLGNATTGYNTPMAPSGHMPPFPGFRPMNLFPRNIRQDFYHPRGGYVPRGRGVRPVVGNPMRYPLYRPPFYGGGGGGGVLQLRNHGMPHTQRPQQTARSLSPDVEIRWTKTLPSVNFSYKKNKERKIDEKVQKNADVATPKEVQYEKDTKSEKKSNNKKSKKQKKDKKEKKSTAKDKNKHGVKSNLRKIAKIRKSFEKSPRCKIDTEGTIKAVEQTSSSQSKHPKHEHKQANYNDKESEMDDAVESSINFSSTEQKSTKIVAQHNNDNSNTTFDIFAESPPRHTKQKTAKESERNHFRSCTPPIELLPSSLQLAAARQNEKTHLQKAIEMQQRIGKLLQDDDLQPETLEATKEKLLQKTRNLSAVEPKPKSKENEKSQKSSEGSNKYVNPFKRDHDDDTFQHQNQSQSHRKVQQRGRRSRERSREQQRRTNSKSRTNSQQNKDDNDKKCTQPKRKPTKSNSPWDREREATTRRSHSRERKHKIAKLEEKTEAASSANSGETSVVAVAVAGDVPSNKKERNAAQERQRKNSRSKKQKNHKIAPLSFNASEFLFPDEDTLASDNENDDIRDKQKNHKLAAHSFNAAEFLYSAENNTTSDNENDDIHDKVDNASGKRKEKTKSRHHSDAAIDLLIGNLDSISEHNSNKQNSPDTDDYMDNWELDDLDASNMGNESTSSATKKAKVNDEDIADKLMARYKNPSPDTIVPNCSAITTDLTTTTTKSSPTATATTAAAIESEVQRSPNVKTTTNELFAMQDIYNEFIKSVEASGVDVSGKDQMDLDAGVGTESSTSAVNTGKRAEKRNLSTSSCSSNSSSSSSSSSSTTSSSSSSSSSGSTSSSTGSMVTATSSSSSSSSLVSNPSASHALKSTTNHSKVHESAKSEALEKVELAEHKTKVKTQHNATETVVPLTSAESVGQELTVRDKEKSEATNAAIDMFTDEKPKSDLQQQQSQTIEQPVEKLEQQQQPNPLTTPTTTTTTIATTNVDPVEFLMSVIPAENTTEAQRIQIAKDIKRVKSYYANLKRTQMMRSNFDASEDIFSELAKMEKLFSHAINFTIQNYTKDCQKVPLLLESSIAISPTTPSRETTNDTTTTSVSSPPKGSAQFLPSMRKTENADSTSSASVAVKALVPQQHLLQTPQPPLPPPVLLPPTPSSSTDEAINIFDSNRETIKLTIAPLKLTKSSAIFDKLDKLDRESANGTGLAGNDDTDFTETLIKTTKEVAIVKPMSKGARSPSARRVSTPRPHTPRDSSSGRRSNSNSRSNSSAYHRSSDYRLRRSSSRSRTLSHRRSHAAALSVSPSRRSSHSRHDSPKRRVRNMSPQRRYRRSRSPVRRGPHRRELSPLSRRRRITTTGGDSRGIRQYDVRSYSRSQSRSRSPGAMHYRQSSGRPHSPRTPPSSTHRRSYSRERYSRSPLPFKPPSPPMRESPDQGSESRRSSRRSRSYSHSPSSPRKLPRSPRSSRSRSPRSPRSPSSSRSPRPRSPSSQYDRHRGREGSYDLFRPHSPPHPHSYFTVQQNLVNIDTRTSVSSDYYYDLSPGQMPMEINVVLNGTESAQRHPPTVYNYEANYQYAGDTSAYLPHGGVPSTAHHPMETAPNSEYYSNLFMPSAQSTYSNVMHGPQNLAHQHQPQPQPHHQHQHPMTRPPNSFYFNNPAMHLPTQMHHNANSSLLKELPKATVAVQKGNVLEIVPSEVSVAPPATAPCTPTATIPMNKAESEPVVCIVAKSTKAAKPVDPVKDEVSKRLQASAKMKEVRKSSGEPAPKGSILKKANRPQPHSQESALMPPAIAAGKSESSSSGALSAQGHKPKKVLFEDGLFPNRDSDDEDMKDAEKRLRMEIRRVKKKGRKAATALYLLLSRKPGSKRRPTMLELSKLPPPPPPAHPLLPHLEQPVPNRPPTPPRYMYYHYDAVVNALYTSPSERGVPPRLTDPKAAAVFAASKAGGIGPTIRARASPIFAMKRDHHGGPLNALKLIGPNHGLRNCASPHSLPPAPFYGARRVNIAYHKPQVVSYQQHQHLQQPPPQQPSPLQHQQQQQQHLFNTAHPPRFNQTTEAPISTLSTQPFSQFKTVTKTMPATFQLIKPQSPQISATLVPSPGQGPQTHHLQQKFQATTSPICFVNNLEIRPLPQQHPVYPLPPVGNAVHPRGGHPPPRPIYPNMSTMPPHNTTQTAANGVALITSGGQQLRPQSYAYHPYVPQSAVRPSSTQHP